MNVSPVLEFLRQKIGLNPESIGTDLIEKAVQEHMKASGIAGIDDYVSKLGKSPEEQKMLIESVVIPETSFFRNKTPFVTLQSYLERFVLNKKRAEPVRILCVPCATGEEPYSIAMVLLAMGLPTEKFFIYAADISEKALQIARAGMYSAYSFRGNNIDFQSKYFTKTDDGYLLKQEVRNAVQFGQANILDANFLLGHKPYDIIFCRNLLIYFDDHTKEKTIKALAAHLAEDGVLFVGHAERAKISRFGFVSLDYPMSFAFARAAYAKVINASLSGSSAPPAPATLPALRVYSSINPNSLLDTQPPLTHPCTRKEYAGGFPAAPQRPFRSQGGNLSGSSPDKGRLGGVCDPNGLSGIKAEGAPLMKRHAPAINEHEKNSNEDTGQRPGQKNIAEAIKLADAGAFTEVAAICDELLAQGAESAQVYYLCGRAAGETGNKLMAEEYLRRAIYLDADFYDALLYLSTLLDRMGNHEKAATFRRRAERVRSRAAGK